MREHIECAIMMALFIGMIVLLAWLPRLLVGAGWLWGV